MAEYDPEALGPVHLEAETVEVPKIDGSGNAVEGSTKKITVVKTGTGNFLLVPVVDSPEENDELVNSAWSYLNPEAAEAAPAEKDDTAQTGTGEKPAGEGTGGAGDSSST